MLQQILLAVASLLTNSKSVGLLKPPSLADFSVFPADSYENKKPAQGNVGYFWKQLTWIFSFNSWQGKKNLRIYKTTVLSSLWLQDIIRRLLMNVTNVQSPFSSLKKRSTISPQSMA